MSCHLADAFIQSDLQLIRLSRRHTSWSNVGLRASLKGPTAVQILSWLHQGSNHRPCGSKSSSLTATLQAAPQLYKHSPVCKCQLKITPVTKFFCSTNANLKEMEYPVLCKSFRHPIFSKNIHLAFNVCFLFSAFVCNLVFPNWDDRTQVTKSRARFAFPSFLGFLHTDSLVPHKAYKTGGGWGGKAPICLF